ncbi:SirB2 family protein [Glaesserella parasuis]|uniref:SirB2 family protein n=1 Tax=Glaesserella parasuis TaxID=738 RepID=UPI0029FDF548|nr:SirB2 family protein [Glaesserella parasuis]MDG6358086.1 SirB2 family protein [Glaesserella parasuis]
MQILGSWSPFTETWLAIKLLLVVVYIVFGVVAQKTFAPQKGSRFTACRYSLF